MLGPFGAIAMGLAVVLGSATFIVPAGLALIGCPHARDSALKAYVVFTAIVTTRCHNNPSSTVNRILTTVDWDR